VSGLAATTLTTAQPAQLLQSSTRLIIGKKKNLFGL
jgi:hypothetical protein